MIYTLHCPSLSKTHLSNEVSKVFLFSLSRSTQNHCIPLLLVLTSHHITSKKGHLPFSTPPNRMLEHLVWFSLALITACCCHGTKANEGDESQTQDICSAKKKVIRWIQTTCSQATCASWESTPRSPASRRKGSS